MTLFGIAINHSKIYFWGLVLASVSLPLSKFTLSISIITLLTNWVLEGDFTTKLNRIKKNSAFWSMALIFLVHVIWLVNTENYSYAFHDLKNKVILVVFPFIVFSSKGISRNEFKNILIWFSAAVVVSSIISTGALIGLVDLPANNPNGISIFISHIRFALLINIAIFSIGYLLVSKDIQLKNSIKTGLLITLLWLVVFLFLLKSLTGILIFLIVLFTIVGFISFRIKYIVSRLFIQVALITVFLLTASFLTHSISKFYSIDKIDLETLENYTFSGNPYQHNLTDKQIENGHFVWLYVSPKELEQEWHKRSSISLNGIDQKGQLIYFTAIRYLTSKGFRKDSLGISKLTDRDIKNIELGMANYIFADKYALYPRVYQVLWELDVYGKNQNPAGNSITQRIIFLKTAGKIIKSNIWTGVGTGDVQDEFNRQYKEDNSQLPENRRHRAHNQWVTFLLTFGVFGFLIIFIAFFYPVFQLKAFRSYLFTVFFIIAFLSMFNEDTLETQTGISFFSYFYSLFLLEIEILKSKPLKNEQDE